MPETVVFPIGYVSITTGLSTHVLRAWERRYGAVKPKRTASGRRLYSQEDIDRLALLKRAVRMKHSISRIADLDDMALAGLISAPGHYVPVSSPEGKPLETATEAIPQLIDACLTATERLDDSGLHDILSQASLKQNRQTIIDAIIVPFLEQVGSRWSQGRMRIAHGHLASSVVATYLHGQLTRYRGASPGHPRLLIATPAGQFCHLGAMAVAVTAQDHGWHPVFLGPDLPCEELAAACLSLRPQMIALSVTCRTDEGFIEGELNRLTGLLDQRYPLFVGGRASAIFRKSIEKAGGTVCRSTNELAQRL